MHRSGTANSLTVIAAGAAGALLLGFWEGHLFAWLSIYSLAVAGWSVWQRERFAAWLHRGNDEPLPGRWGQIASQVARRLHHERERNKRLRRLLSRVREASSVFPDGVVMLDAGRRIRWMNAAAVRMLDLDARRDVGQRLANLVRHPKLSDSLEHSDGDELIILESPVDASRLVSLQAVAVPDDLRMLVVRDVTELESSEAARRDFVANASHELRSPLTVIRGYLDALVDDEGLDPAWAAPVEEMHRQARRMSDLLRDLMDLARLERVYRSAEFLAIHPQQLFGEVRDDLLAGAENPPLVQISTDGSHDLCGEVSEIRLVVTNLLANALRYTPAEGLIVLRWYVDDSGGHLQVRDNGVGIEEDHIPRLAERFYRVDRGRSRKEGGTGLGLAIVNNALSRHEARLEIRSRPGEGSIFTCHFPPHRLVPVPTDVLMAG